MSIPDEILAQFVALDPQQRLRKYEELAVERHNASQEIARLDVEIATLRDLLATAMAPRLMPGPKKANLKSEFSNALSIIRSQPASTRGNLTAVLRALQKSPNRRATPREMAALMKCKSSAAQMRLKRALKVGLVEQPERGTYTIAE